MLHHTEFHFGKIEQTPHQSDIEYTSFAATSLIHPYMTSMTKMLNAFAPKDALDVDLLQSLISFAKVTTLHCWAQPGGRLLIIQFDLQLSVV